MRLTQLRLPSTCAALPTDAKRIDSALSPVYPTKCRSDCDATRPDCFAVADCGHWRSNRICTRILVAFQCRWDRDGGGHPVATLAGRWWHLRRLFDTHIWWAPLRRRDASWPSKCWRASVALGTGLLTGFVQPLSAVVAIDWFRDPKAESVLAILFGSLGKRWVTSKLTWLWRPNIFWSVLACSLANWSTDFSSSSFATSRFTSCVWSALDIFWCLGVMEFSIKSLEGNCQELIQCQLFCGIFILCDYFDVIYQQEEPFFCA